MSSVPPSHRGILETETYGHLATLMPDGLPHVTPVWVDYETDPEYVVCNTVTGRQKERNMRRNPIAGMNCLDPSDPYRYVSVRGTVAEMTTDGAVAHIDELAAQYMDVDRYPNHDSEDGERVIVRIRPEHVITSG